MTKLTEEEAAKLKELQAKRDAPDEEPASGHGRTVNFNVDLGDPEQVGLARRLGFLPPDASSSGGGASSSSGGGASSSSEAPPEEEPRRAGFFRE